jgi:hypothetical protein
MRTANSSATSCSFLSFASFHTYQVLILGTVMARRSPYLISRTSCMLTNTYCKRTISINIRVKDQDNPSSPSRVGRDQHSHHLATLEYPPSFGGRCSTNDIVNVTPARRVPAHNLIALKLGEHSAHDGKSSCVGEKAGRRWRRGQRRRCLSQ